MRSIRILRPMRSALVAGGLVLAIVPAGAVAAGAAGNAPENANCLGVVTSQRAVAHHDLGEHASEQEEPRQGIGNITREILGEDAHVGDFGAFLGEIDGDDATQCPRP